MLLKLRNLWIVLDSMAFVGMAVINLYQSTPRMHKVKIYLIAYGQVPVFLHMGGTFERLGGSNIELRKSEMSLREKISKGLTFAYTKQWIIIV